MDIGEFLDVVITAPDGYFAFGAGDGHSNWTSEYYCWPQQRGTIIDRATLLGQQTNTYFSTYLFSEPSHKREFVLPTNRTLTVDLDEANVEDLPLLPTVLNSTSTYKHHGFWTVKSGNNGHGAPEGVGSSGVAEIEPATLEVLSRKLTYAIPLADRSGWPLGRFIRFPYTYNFKYPEGPQLVTIKSASLRQYELRDLELLPDTPATTLMEEDQAFIENPPELTDLAPHELLNQYAHKLPAKVVSQYDQVMPDRSNALWLLMVSAFRVGLHRSYVYWLARYSANNKFAALRYHGDRELAKDVLRAEKVAYIDSSDVRGQVRNARQLPGSQADKREHMANIVLAHMQDEGKFIRTQDDHAWYVRNDLGRPIAVDDRSEWLDMLLDIRYGLNAMEADHSFVCKKLIAYLRSLPNTSVSGALSWYDADSNTLLLHTGKKEVLRIAANNIEHTINGAYGVIFPWLRSLDPFTPQLGADDDWAATLFGNSLDNVVEMGSEEATALLKVWTIFVLLRNAAISRPILALFGQPGAGKSTLFRKIYAFIYGPHRSLGSATSPDNFDQSVSTDPLLVLDNVDSWERWLPDRLALSASTSDVDKRRLWTNSDTYTLKRQAMLGITAHNPRFGREDVMDRLLLLTLGRLPEDSFRDEASMFNAVLSRRNYLWGSLIQDVQRVLATPLPSHDETPPFRVQDFARIGLRIARGLDVEHAFRRALEATRTGARVFVLEEENILVDAIQRMIARPDYAPTWRSVASLWADLEMCSEDQMAFIKYYRNAVQLGKKLWVLQTSLKTIMPIEWQYDTNRGARLWYIG